MVTGGIVIVAIMLLLVPVAIMLGGAIWSAVMGWSWWTTPTPRRRPSRYYGVAPTGVASLAAGAQRWFPNR